MANAHNVSNTFLPSPGLTWRHPAFQARRQGRARSEHVHQAQLLWARALRHRTRLAEPDAWLSLGSSTLSFQPTPGAQALRPGDVLQTALWQASPLITHDALYVGKGFVIAFARRWRYSMREGVIQIHRLDQGLFASTTWLPVTTPPRLSAAERLQRVWRALSCTGYFEYDPVLFNCQNVVAFWLNPHLRRTASLGARRILSAVVVGTTVVTCASLVAAVALLDKPRPRPRPRP